MIKKQEEQEQWAKFDQSIYVYLLNAEQLKKKKLSLKLRIFFFVFLGPYLQHMEVPRLGVELEL